MLHATFFGAKLPNADVENLLLYNIDSFKVAGRNGIRFEHGDGVPPAPDGGRVSVLLPLRARAAVGCLHPLAAGANAGLVRLDRPGRVRGREEAGAGVAGAGPRRRHEVVEPAAAPETPFAVRVQVRPPLERQPVLGGLVKGIFDGVICAFQAHTDTAVLPEVVARLAKDLPADPAEIEEHLLDQRRAVLGAVHRLVSPYRAGVKWDPSDHLCVAGELLPRNRSMNAGPSRERSSSSPAKTQRIRSRDPKRVSRQVDLVA